MDFPEELKKFKDNILFECETTDVYDSTTFALHYFLAGLASLEQAIHLFELAEAYKARELAGNL